MALTTLGVRDIPRTAEKRLNLSSKILGVDKSDLLTAINTLAKQPSPPPIILPSTKVDAVCNKTLINLSRFLTRSATNVRPPVSEGDITLYLYTDGSIPFTNFDSRDVVDTKQTLRDELLERNIILDIPDAEIRKLLSNPTGNGVLLYKDSTGKINLFFIFAAFGG